MMDRRFRFILAAIALLAGMTNTAADDRPAQPPPIPPTAEQIAGCTSEAADRDKAVAACGFVIGNDRTARADRLAALLVRAKLNATGNADGAIADYSAALAIDPAMADALNARGELRRAKGDRPRALMDFSAALKVDPNNVAARDNRKSLSQEIERIGAEMAVGNKAAPPKAPAPLK